MTSFSQAMMVGLHNHSPSGTTVVNNLAAFTFTDTKYKTCILTMTYMHHHHQLCSAIVGYH